MLLYETKQLNYTEELGAGNIELLAEQVTNYINSAVTKLSENQWDIITNDVYNELEAIVNGGEYGGEIEFDNIGKKLLDIEVIINKKGTILVSMFY